MPSNTYLLAQDSWLAYVGLTLSVLGFGVSFAFLLGAVGSGKQALQKADLVEEGGDVDYKVFRRRSVYMGRLLLICICSLIATYFFVANGFFWFHEVRVSNDSIELIFNWPRGPAKIPRNDIGSVGVAAFRRSAYLVIGTRQKERFRSVSVKDSKQLRQLRDVLAREQEKVKWVP